MTLLYSNVHLWGPIQMQLHWNVHTGTAINKHPETAHQPFFYIQWFFSKKKGKLINKGAHPYTRTRQTWLKFKIAFAAPLICITVVSLSAPRSPSMEEAVPSEGWNYATSLHHPSINTSGFCVLVRGCHVDMDYDYDIALCEWIVIELVTLELFQQYFSVNE
jgi:hypothetical protein